MGGSTSLVLTNQTLPSGEDGCPWPRPGMRLFHRETGETRPVGCGRQKCPGCGPFLAWRRAVAIAWARPERQIDLTLVGDAWQTVRARMNRVRYDIEALGYGLEWSWHVEPNPAGTGHHVHAFAHGDYIPQAVLSDVADRRGMGYRAYIQAYRVAHEAASYGLKGAGYGLKGAARAEALYEYLVVNGGRLSHHSRGFFRGVGVGEAESRAMMALRGGESPWVITSVDELHRAHAVRGEGRKWSSAERRS